MTNLFTGYINWFDEVFNFVSESCVVERFRSHKDDQIGNEKSKSWKKTIYGFKSFLI